MKVAYFDAFSGISGDMTVGALLALGMPLEHLTTQLGRVDVHGYSVSAVNRQINGIQAIKFDVHLDPDHESGHHTHRAGHTPHAHRSFADIQSLIERSALDAPVKAMALRIFTRLAEAEGRVHGVAPEAVTFHEVGAIDSIVDVIGTAVGVVYHGIERAYVSALATGSGMVQSQHGPLPVPPPAVVELLGGYQLRIGDGHGELVTPTGAAIIAAIADTGAPPPLRVKAVGYGAGTRVLADRPNVLRLVLAEVDEALARDRVVVLETNIDDTNPELYDFVFERLFAAGARDVFLSAIQMKKNRPGTLLRVICDAADRDALAAVVLSETSAIGLRFFEVDRLKLPRTVATVQTEYGPIRVKVARAPGGHDNVAPEYDDCARIARERGVPLKLVYQAALAAHGRIG